MKLHILGFIAAAMMIASCGTTPPDAETDAVGTSFPAEDVAADQGATTPADTAQAESAADRATPEGPDALPDTASPLALIGLGGLLSLAGALGLRALRR